MVESAGTQIFDQSIKSAVNIERLAANTQRKVVNLLNAAESDIIKKLAEIDPMGVSTLTAQQKRLANLGTEINRILGTKYSSINSTVSRDLQRLAAMAGPETAAIVNGAVGVDIFNVRLSENQLKALVQEARVEGTPIGDWWKKQSADAKLRYNGALTSAVNEIRTGILTGESIGQITRRIRGTPLRPGPKAQMAREAKALVRTTTAQVHNAARQAVYKQNQHLIQNIQIVATLDARTTQLCMGLDGLEYTLPDYQPVGHDVGYPKSGGPPFHWQCRTTTIPVLKPFNQIVTSEKLPPSKIRRLNKLSPGKRAAIDGPVRATTNYGQWLKTQPKSVQLEILGPGRHKLWSENKLSLTQMLSQEGRPLTIAEMNSGFFLAEARANRVIEELGRRPMTTKQIQRAAWNTENKTFRKTLNDMERRGEVVQDPRTGKWILKDKNPGAFDEAVVLKEDLDLDLAVSPISGLKMGNEKLMAELLNNGWSDKKILDYFTNTIYAGKGKTKEWIKGRVNTYKRIAIKKHGAARPTGKKPITTPEAPVTPTPPKAPGTKRPDWDAMRKAQGEFKNNNFLPGVRYFDKEYNIKINYPKSYADKKGWELQENLARLGKETDRLVDDFPQFKKLFDDYGLDFTMAYDKLAGKGKGTLGWCTRFEEYMKNGEISIRDKLTFKNSSPLRMGKNQWSPCQGQNDIWRHELAHHWQNKSGPKLRGEWQRIANEYSKEQIKENVGMYASSHWREFFAESFAAYTHPNYGIAAKTGFGAFPTRLPKKIEEYMIKYIGKHPNL